MAYRTGRICIAITVDCRKRRVNLQFLPYQHPFLACQLIKCCRLNMDLDLQSLFGLHFVRTTVLIGWDPATPPPPHLGSYTRTLLLLVCQDRRHLFVTLWLINIQSQMMVIFKRTAYSLSKIENNILPDSASAVHSNKLHSKLYFKGLGHSRDKIQILCRINSSRSE